MNLKSFLYTLGTLAVVMTCLPLIPLDAWWIRMFDFPHVQLTVFTLIALVSFVTKFKIDDWKEYVFVGALISCFIYQGIKVYPYTPTASLEVRDSSNTQKNQVLKLYTANVLQKNKHYDTINQQIHTLKPDIILLTETDKKWRNAIVSQLPSDYKYQKEAPLDNTYGMVLYSKLELKNPETHFFVNDSIPSMSSEVKLPDGSWIQLYTIHPTPPMPQENPMSTDRDAEMMIVAEKCRNSKLTVVVLGDFNDVAWSKTTNLFQRTGELLDLRKGRGFYCSYDANNMIFRWPLDHLFISDEFRLKKVMLCDKTGSDHFPFYTELTYEPNLAHEQTPEPPTELELTQANDQIKRLRKKRPIANN